MNRLIVVDFVRNHSLEKNIWLITFVNIQVHLQIVENKNSWKFDTDVVLLIEQMNFQARRRSGVSTVQRRSPERITW